MSTDWSHSNGCRVLFTVLQLHRTHTHNCPQQLEQQPSIMANNNRFGIFYPITRITLGVIIAIQIILLIVVSVDLNKHGYIENKTETITVIVISFILLFIGIIGAWKENFLFVTIFTIAELILTIVGFIYNTTSGIGIVLTLVVSAIYGIMLYMSGNQGFGCPSIP